MTSDTQKQSYKLTLYGNRYMTNMPEGKLAAEFFQIDAFSSDIVVFSIPRYGTHGFFVGNFTAEKTPTTAADISGTLNRFEQFDGTSLIRHLSWDLPSPIESLFNYEAYLPQLGGDDYFMASTEGDGTEKVQTLAGNDRYKGYFDNGSGSNHSASNKGDYFYGGEGIDTSIYQGKISEYTITPTSAENVVGIYDHRLGDGTRIPGFYVDDSVAGRDGSDRLAEVERLEFEVAEDNGANHIALDIDGHAGTAAKIVGALWGKEALDNPQLIGILLHGLDSGFTYDDVLDFALGAILGPNKTNNDVAELVYLNLIGEPPTEAVTKELASYMDSGAFSQAAFTRAVADLETNATNIDLVGLANTGLQYVEYVV